MKKFTTLMACLCTAWFLVTSCSKEDANLSSSQSYETDEKSEGNYKELLQHISSVYGYGSIGIQEGMHSGTSGQFGNVQYRFFNSETETANHVVKMAIYFADADSTFFLYANPDASVNKITYRGMDGNRTDDYRDRDFEDLYLFDEKVITDLEVTGIDPARKRALTFALAYTFATQEIVEEIVAPAEPVNPVFKVRVRRESVNPDPGSFCADPECVVRDGMIRMGRITLWWWHCAC